MQTSQNIKTFNFKSATVEVEIKDLSFIKELPKLFERPHKVSFYQLMWVKEGTAKHIIDFQEIVLYKNDVLVIAPGQVCQFDIISNYSGKMILFTDSFFSVSEADSNFLHTSQILSLVKQNRIVSICPILMNNLIALLVEEMQMNADNFQVSISQSILRIILFEAERQLNTSQSFNVASIAHNFCNAVEKHFKEEKSVEFYINLLAINEKALSKEIKNITGNTPKTYINNRIILEAKRLLVYSNLSAKEIGFTLGFDEPTNFNNFFRKQTSHTPLQFRENSIN